jgi:hypothetical protein
MFGMSKDVIGAMKVRALANAARAAKEAEAAVVTVYRGMTSAEFEKLAQTLTLESKAMQAGLARQPSAIQALWHTMTSSFPKSPYVSTTTIPSIARRIFAGKAGEVVAKIQIPRAALTQSINVFEAEYLAKGGTKIIAVQLAPAGAKASAGAITLWLTESTLAAGLGIAVTGGTAYVVKVVVGS